MASTGYNLNPTDVAMGKALTAGIDAYTDKYPDQFEHEIGTAAGMTPSRLSGCKSGAVPLYVREVKALAKAGIFEPLMALVESCGARLVLDPGDTEYDTLRPHDAMDVLKECTEGTSATVDFLSADTPTEGKRVDALRELDEAAVKILIVRRAVARQRIKGGAK